MRDRRIHFMSLDTEGSELSILQTFPFDRYPLALVALEANNGDVTVQAHKVLVDAGFVLSEQVWHDRYYIHLGVRDYLRRPPNDDALHGLQPCRLIGATS